MRERVAAACGQSGSRVVAVADQFSVSVSYVEKLLHRQRTTGSVAALPPRSSPTPDLDAPAREALRACLRQEPDATLAELCTWLAAIGGPAVSQSTSVVGSAGAGLAAKKKSVHAVERDARRVVARRRAVVEVLQTQNFTCFKFVDEASANLMCCRRYARAEGRQRAHQATPLHGGPNVTLVAALTPTGLHKRP